MNFFNEAFDFNLIKINKKQLIKNGFDTIRKGQLNTIYKQQVLDNEWKAFNNDNIFHNNENIDFNIIDVKYLNKEHTKYIFIIDVFSKKSNDTFYIDYSDILEYYENILLNNEKDNIIEKTDKNIEILPLYINNVDTNVEILFKDYSSYSKNYNNNINNWEFFPRTINGNLTIEKDSFFNIYDLKITDFNNFPRTINGTLKIDILICCGLLNLENSYFTGLELNAYNSNIYKNNEEDIINCEGLENKNLKYIKLIGCFKSLKGLPVIKNADYVEIDGYAHLLDYNGFIIENAKKVRLGGSNQTFDGIKLGNIEELEIHNTNSLQGLNAIYIKHFYISKYYKGTDIFENTNFKKIDYIDFSDNISFNSFKGLELTEIKRIELNNYTQINSLVGLPFILERLILKNLKFIKDLQGLPKNIKDLKCIECKSLKTLKGMENSVILDFSCESNIELEDISNIGNITREFRILGCNKINGNDILDIKNKIAGNIKCNIEMDNISILELLEIDKNNKDFNNIDNKMLSYNEALFYFAAGYKKHDTKYIIEEMEDTLNINGVLSSCPTIRILFNKNNPAPYNRFDGELCYQIDADITGTLGYEGRYPWDGADTEIYFENEDYYLYYFDDDYNDYCEYAENGVYDENSDIETIDDDGSDIWVDDIIDKAKTALLGMLEKDIDLHMDDYISYITNESLLTNRNIIKNTINEYFNIKK